MPLTTLERENLWNVWRVDEARHVVWTCWNEVRMHFGQQSRDDRREVYDHIWISIERSQLYVNLTVIYLNDFKSMVNTLTHLKM